MLENSGNGNNMECSHYPTTQSQSLSTFWSIFLLGMRTRITETVLSLALWLWKLHRLLSKFF